MGVGVVGLLTTTTSLQFLTVPPEVVVPVLLVTSHLLPLRLRLPQVPFVSNDDDKTAPFGATQLQRHTCCPDFGSADAWGAIAVVAPSTLTNEMIFAQRFHLASFEAPLPVHNYVPLRLLPTIQYDSGPLSCRCFSTDTT